MNEIERLEEGVRRAVAKDDMESAKTLAVALKEARNADPAYVAKDVAKSGGQGLRNAAEGTVSQFGDLPAVGGSLIEKGLSYITSPEKAKEGGEAFKKGADVASGLPTWLARRTYRRLTGGDKPGEDFFSTESTPIASPGREDVEKFTTEKTGVGPHRAQTEMGKKVEPAAEFAASALSPGSRGRRVGDAIVGALTGLGAHEVGDEFRRENASQYAPAAELATALTIPLLTHGKNLYRKGPTTDKAKFLEELGIPLTAGQATRDVNLQLSESEIGGNRMRDVQDQQKAAFTAKALEAAGAPPGTMATDENMRNLRKDLGQQFDDMAASTTVPMDQTLQNSLLDIVTNYGESAPSVVSGVENTMNRMAQLAAQNGGVLTGTNYKELMTHIRTLADGADPKTALAFGDMRKAIDDAVERSMGGEQVKAWKDLRGKYNNFMIAEKSLTGAAQDAAEGVISPVRLRTSLGTQEGAASVAEGRNTQLGPLADAGVSAMKPPPNSGTSMRLFSRGSIPFLSDAVVGAKGAALMSPWVQNLLKQTPRLEGREGLTALIAAERFNRRNE